MDDLIGHLEQRLGRMGGGWPVNGRGGHGDLTIAYFDGGTMAGVASYATIGLSHCRLQSRVSDQELRLELVASEHGKPREASPLPHILGHVAQELQGSGEAVLRGDVIPLPMPLASDGRMTAMYASLPVYFDPPFKSVRVAADRHVAIVWLFPLTTSEVAFIEEHGYPPFEQLLEQSNPDLLDLTRPAIA